MNISHSEISKAIVLGDIRGVRWLSNFRTQRYDNFNVVYLVQGTRVYGTTKWFGAYPAACFRFEPLVHLRAVEVIVGQSPHLR